MIRERRNKEKLRRYYHDFISTGKPDNNVHPLIADSWLQSYASGIPTTKPHLTKLSVNELALKQANRTAEINFLSGMYQNLAEYLNKYNISMLLSDTEGYVLKSYTLPFLQNCWAGTEGYCLAEEETGTSSMSIALANKIPFLLFGPETWLTDFHSEDSCSAPIILEDDVACVITMIYSEQQELPYSAPYSLLLSIKYSLEEYLQTQTSIKVMHTILDTLPMAIYQIQADSKISYANKTGISRLKEICPDTTDTLPYLNSLVLNYYHTPLEKGFLGIPAINKEVTWITAKKTYEDITTVIPIQEAETVNSIFTVTLPIEELKALVAHAAAYRSRYTLSGMVGNSPVFLTMKKKALRVARNQNHLLIQGESGTGKQRLAHGIHQSSPRAAGPFITVRCGDMPPDLLGNELFGNVESQPLYSGKLELANGGTLFLDEVEELPWSIAVCLYETLALVKARPLKDISSHLNNIRIIAACDSDLKRLTDKGTFFPPLYELLAKTTLRVPSLRDRKSDIPIIAKHIISELAEQHQLPPKHFAPETLELLETFEWSGNVKELQSVTEHAFFNTTTATIQPDNIKASPTATPGCSWKRDEHLFLDAWKAAGGNISRLATTLGVSRVTLYRYLKKFGLNNSERRT